MALILREDDVRRLLKMPETIKVIGDAFAALGDNKAANRPRVRIRQTNGVMNILPASIPSMGYMGHKTYTVFRSGMHFVVMLYSAQDGELLAIIEADWLSGIRAGATSALATEYLARRDATTVGMIGAGKQAAMQLRGMCAVRRITQVLVYSLHVHKCDYFCKQMSEELQIDVRPASSALEAIQDADIVITATTASQPVFHGDFLRAGCHINAIGSNWPDRREIDQVTLQHCDLIVSDSRDQALKEAGDLLIPYQAGQFDFNRVYDLAQIVAGTAPRRQSAHDITLYEGLGTAIEDIAASGLAYSQAIELGVGEDINLLS